MSNVLQRVANIHRDRWAKAEKARLLYERKLAAEKAYFKDSGIPEMWDDVKNIIIANPCPDVIEGFTVPLVALVVETAEENIKGTGLRLHDKNGAEAVWHATDMSNHDDEKFNINYSVEAGKTSFCVKHDAVGAKNMFVESFVKWLSKYITPIMLADMDIDPEPASVVKRSRKILQLAET